MAQTWWCEGCGREGAYLTAVVSVLRRHPTDPAEDRVKCDGCGAEGKRYDFLKQPSQ